MAKMSLPPGFRFYPTDVELVKYYLKRKVLGKKFHFDAIAEVDIYKFAPWDLPAKSCLRTRDLKWFFFCPREKKYSNGSRMNRATEFGYWKTTGRDRPVSYNNEDVGKIKTLVFHIGKAPRGERTDWVMHEYRLEENGLADRGVAQDSYVLCIVFQKDGLGPRNGAQYGAPFREEDWDDDEDVDHMEVVSSAVLSTPVPNIMSPVAASAHVPDTQCIGSSESCLSDGIPSAYKVLSPIPENTGVSSEVPQGSGDDDIARMLDIFTEDSPLVLEENGQSEKLDNDHNENVEAPSCSDGIDIYTDLGDLGNLGGLSDGVYNFSTDANADYTPNQMFLGDNMPFLELRDLDAPLNLPARAVGFELVRTNELYNNKNCYNSEQSCVPVNNPLLSQSPTLPEQSYNSEDQLVAFLKDYGACGDAQQPRLIDGNAALFKPLSLGSTHFSEDLRRGGSHHAS